ncbi:2-amino-1-hydroxyethylphosphonate dioxygenase (glycine-forming)-like [Antedon mediterranea]|uniref:2-amino-1-hydroxyethylphosphonate dioxygenase (glycine-forming)-like n=1 Tax=Antedon mediterranea TaxID=105859 RepID=UPI003AF5D3EB
MNSHYYYMFTVINRLFILIMTSIDIQRIFELYENYGDSEYIGEAVSQKQHMIQCAMLAEKEGYPKQIVLGALFHDIGHLVGMAQGLEGMVTTEGVKLGIVNHETVGETFLLDLGIPQEIAAFVRGHVDAKRYLVYKDKSYYEGLSRSSKQTLTHQGGPMIEEEAKQFEKSPYFDAILRMRRWDELAKDPNAHTEPLDKYKQLCQSYLEQRNTEISRI